MRFGDSQRPPITQPHFGQPCADAQLPIWLWHAHGLCIDIGMAAIPPNGQMWVKLGSVIEKSIAGEIMVDANNVRHSHPAAQLRQVAVRHPMIAEAMIRAVLNTPGQKIKAEPAAFIFMRCLIGEHGGRKAAPQIFCLNQLCVGRDCPHGLHRKGNGAALNNRRPQQ